MSNTSLPSGIEFALTLLRNGDASCAAFAETLRNNGRALEGMSYRLIREMERLAASFDIASWHMEEGALPEISGYLAQVEDWLREVSCAEA